MPAVLKQIDKTLCNECSTTFYKNNTIHTRNTFEIECKVGGAKIQQFFHIKIYRQSRNADVKYRIDTMKDLSIFIDKDQIDKDQIKKIFSAILPTTRVLY